MPTPCPGGFCDNRLRRTSSAGDSGNAQTIARNQQGAWTVRTDCQIVLLGSIATPKYTKPLLEIFANELFFPAEFVGRGDMSRGGLMLRQVSAVVQLNYVPVAKAQRYGSKPPDFSSFWIAPLAQLELTCHQSAIAPTAAPKEGSDLLSVTHPSVISSLGLDSQISKMESTCVILNISRTCLVGLMSLR
jgi:hypothetical protein